MTELLRRHHTQRSPRTEGSGKLHRLVIALHPAVPAGVPDDPDPGPAPDYDPTHR